MKSKKNKTAKQIINELSIYIQNCTSGGRLKCPQISLLGHDFETVRAYLNRGNEGKDGFWFDGAWIKPIKIEE